MVMSRALSRPQILVIAAAAVVLGVSLGVRQTFGIYLVPMTLDLDWSRGLFGLAMAVQNLVWGAAQPFVGGLADRFGSGKVIAGGAVFYALGVIGMASVVTPAGLLITGGVLIGLGMAGAGIAVVYGAVSRAVAPENRTYAVALVSTIGALGPMTFPLISQAVIGVAGWAFSLTATAIIVLLLILLTRLFDHSEAIETGEPDLNLREVINAARKNSGYILLVSGFFVCGFHVTFIGTHFPGYINLQGLDAGVGAVALTVIGVGNIIGTYLAGESSKKYRQKNVLSFIYLGRALLIAALMILPTTEWTIYAFSAVFGLLWLSTVPLTSGVVARIFGAKHLGMLFGFVFFSHQIGAFFGAWLGGVAFDTFGNYTSMWYASIALGLLAALLHWPIRDQPMEHLVSPQSA
ncbi:MAG: MFS transporter [Alphaproteobacteria bacterium]|nr:MFS transporter [Alphaproteobacteria bacterium]